MKFIKFSLVRDRWKDIAIAASLLLILLAVLLTPTIKAVRTIEENPKDVLFYPVELNAGAQVVDVVSFPEEAVTYIIAWVKDRHDVDDLTKSDYEGVKLEVADTAGNVMGAASSPEFIKRADKPALLFTLASPIKSTGEQYTLTFTQHGEGTVWMLQPHKDQVYENEQVTVALQFGQRKNWITLLVDKVYTESFDGKDIASYLHRGSQIVAGENPYSCITSEKQICAGYPAHLPGMYYIAALAVKFGVGELGQWAQVWRPVVFGIWLAIGITLFSYAFVHRKPALAVFSFGFWLFNRWSIDVLRIAHTDFIGALFLLLAVIFADGMPLLAAFLLGVSLSVKQLAILVVPLFIILWWRSDKISPKKMAALIGMIALMPIATTLPFFIDNPKATFIGVTNVITRPAQGVHGFAPSLDAWLDVTFVHRSIIMFVLIAMIYIAGWKRSLTLPGGVLLILITMIAFTHVLYNQYVIWLLPFAPLTVMSMLLPKKKPAQERVKVESTAT